MLLTAEVDPKGMIAFFELLHSGERGLPATVRYLTSHPLAEDRVTSLKRLAGSIPNRPRPLLPDRDWSDVRKICAS